MIKAVIILYCLLLGFFYTCDIHGGCMSNPAFWPYYYVTDHAIDCMLWFIVWKNSDKYKVPAFLVFCFSLIRCVWLASCYISGINPSQTYWTVILFFCLLPVIYYTVFVPNGRFVKFLIKYSPFISKP